MKKKNFIVLIFLMSVILGLTITSLTLKIVDIRRLNRIREQPTQNFCDIFVSGFFNISENDFDIKVNSYYVVGIEIITFEFENILNIVNYSILFFFVEKDFNKFFRTCSSILIISSDFEVIIKSSFARVITINPFVDFKQLVYESNIYYDYVTIIINRF